MPEVTFRPINQCTLDDPTDGAEPPSFIPDPSSGVAETPRGSDLVPQCRATVSGAGGRGGDECTDALVRRFSSEGGAPVIREPEHAGSCFHDAVNALQTCTPLLAAATLPKSYITAQSAACVVALSTLVGCLVENDAAVR